jgi:LacI family transcriptional regulator
VYGLGLAFCIQPHLKLETLLMLKKSKIPVVCFFGSLGVCGWPSVCSDIGAQAYIATKHLCEIGRKKIAFVGTRRPLGLAATEATVTQHGFMRALFEANNNFYPDLQFLLDEWSESSVTEQKENELAKQLEIWLDRHRDLDAVFCTSDHTAYPVIAALKNLGKDVPDDVAVVGCGNLGKYHKSVAGDLTTVDICIDEIAANACDLLVAMRNGEQVAEGLTIAVEGKLLIGKSTFKK